MIRQLRIQQFRESPTNRRREYRLDEIAPSVKEHGVLQPLLVRPLQVHTTEDEPSIGPEDPVEIVYGHRRFRAAKLVGLKELPADVRILSDATALELQLIENAARHDIHPLDEAETIGELHTKHGVSVDEIAAKLGRTLGYVYGRLKLLELGDEGKEAYLAGKLGFAIAVLVARIGDRTVQARAIDEITRANWEGQLPTAREQQRLVRQKFTLRLAHAPFSCSDPELLVAAGPCTTCPKRSGTQRALFDDDAFEDDELCLDLTCFNEKKEAAWTMAKEKAIETGKEVLPEKEAKKLFGLGNIKHNAAYVDLDAPCEYKPEHTWGKVLGKKVTTVLARDNNGAARDLVSRDEAVKIAERKGLLKHQASAPEEDEEQSREREQYEFRRVVVDDLIGRALAKVENMPTDDVWLWRHVARWMVSEGFADKVMDLRKWEEGEETAKLDQLSEAELRVFVFEVLIRGAVCVLYGGSYSSDVDALAKQFGFSVKKIEADVRKRLEHGPEVKLLAAAAPKCRECGCTDNAACETDAGVCSWAEPDLCSACVPPASTKAKKHKRSNGEARA